MSAQTDSRSFLRLVVLVSILTSGVAAGVIRGEVATRPYIRAVVVDGTGLGLTGEVGEYGEAARDLHARLGHEGAP